MKTVLITGSTGNVGREVVSAALARALVVRAADRGTPGGSTNGVECVRLDFRDRSSFECTQGVDGIFLMRPPAISDVAHTLLPFIDEARRRGVKHVVFLSVAGAGTNQLVPHHAVEQHLMKGTGWTILRPGFFAQNFQDAYRLDITEDARVYVPAGRGKVTFVDVRDVADVAVSALESPAEHDGEAYTLTGPEAVDFVTATDRLSSVLGRTIRYEAASIIGYALHLRRHRAMPWAQAAVQTILHVGLRFGQAENVDPTLAGLLSKPPRTLDEYFRDSRAIWATNAH